MPKVVFDSSFLLAVVERPTTWFEDMTELLGALEPVTLDCVLAEMDRLSVGQGRRGRYASLAKQLASKFQVAKAGRAGVDEEIVSYALANGAAVATLDRELIGALKGLRVKVVTLRAGRVARV